MRAVAGLLIYGAPVVVAAVGPAAFWDNGCLEREAITFMTRSTADLPTCKRCSWSTPISGYAVSRR